jgi:pimeloyl-ACP methyl ester carboxylesterase
LNGTIVFSHANGFGASTYEPIFRRWRAEGWRVVAIERIGHDPAHPPTSNWPHLRNELLGFIAWQAPGETVHLVGHSLGGFLSLLAASRQPGLARSITLLDSPLIAGWRAHALHMIKTSRLIGRVSPGKVAQRRRHQWPDRAAVLAHFQAKPAFARWDAEMLAAYVASGFDDAADGSGGVVLGFRRDIETRIYNTLPHHIADLLRRHPVRCPVSFIGGRSSEEVRTLGLVATRALTHGRIRWIEGGHLFPMERPAETAEQVLQAIRQAA